jgi:hypothetical protein
VGHLPFAPQGKPLKSRKVQSIVSKLTGVQNGQLSSSTNLHELSKWVADGLSEDEDDHAESNAQAPTHTNLSRRNSRTRLSRSASVDSQCQLQSLTHQPANNITSHAATTINNEAEDDESDDEDDDDDEEDDDDTLPSAKRRKREQLSENGVAQDIRQFLLDQAHEPETVDVSQLDNWIVGRNRRKNDSSDDDDENDIDWNPDGTSNASGDDDDDDDKEASATTGRRTREPDHNDDDDEDDGDDDGNNEQEQLTTSRTPVNKSPASTSDVLNAFMRGEWRPTDKHTNAIKSK